MMTIEETRSYTDTIIARLGVGENFTHNERFAHILLVAAVANSTAVGMYRNMYRGDEQWVMYDERTNRVTASPEEALLRLRQQAEAQLAAAQAKLAALTPKEPTQGAHPMTATAAQALDDIADNLLRQATERLDAVAAGAPDPADLVAEARALNHAARMVMAAAAELRAVPPQEPTDNMPMVKESAP